VLLPSRTATQEFVVPKSIPITFAISSSLPSSVLFGALSFCYVVAQSLISRRSFQAAF
jgi:hypothetical protein